MRDEACTPADTGALAALTDARAALAAALPARTLESRALPALTLASAPAERPGQYWPLTGLSTAPPPALPLASWLALAGILLLPAVAASWWWCERRRPHGSPARRAAGGGRAGSEAVYMLQGDA